MTTTSLTLQNPAEQDSEYLLDALLEQSIDALRGAAAYAWATQKGISLLLGDAVFGDFLRAGDFQLIVGVDSVTTPDALRALAAAESKFPGLSVRAFMSAAGEGLFHPKVAWFGHRLSGSLIVGSGNLTGGGLWDNREAFTLSVMDNDLMNGVQQQWAAWRTANAARLYPVLDPQVLERAKQNTRWTRARVEPVSEPSATPSVAPVPALLDERTVLIAEIPGHRNKRWNQVNYHRDDYEQFFGARVGTKRLMLFQSLNEDGSLGEVEPNRPSVQVRSRNWRFELRAPRGLAYPENGRPIGVYLRLRARTFLYMVSMPGDAVHDELVVHLASAHARTGQMRTLCEDVKAAGGLEAVRRLVSASNEAFSDEVSD